MKPSKKFARSIYHAVKGIVHVAKTELNFQIQLFFGAVVMVLMIVLPLQSWERILLILMIAAVLVLEVLNTALERISDALKPRLSPVVRDVKDMMAGAVLLTSLTALVVGILIFWTYLFSSR